VVIGAHYDVFGDLPGADDNASGVAGLLELARLLEGMNLPTAVELVAYSSEEPPFFGGPQMGSAVHVAALKSAAVSVRAMISLEMIGCFTERQPHQGIILTTIYPRHGRFIALAGRWDDRDLVADAKKCFRGASPIETVSYSGPTGLGADLSDQRNYWAAGIPAFMVTDTAFMRNPNYHTATDTADTLDYERMADVVDGVLSTVVMLARH
jgi:Zn-dependent M28 family amino/carboxypeptidase